MKCLMLNSEYRILLRQFSVVIPERGTLILQYQAPAVSTSLQGLFQKKI